MPSHLTIAYYTTKLWTLDFFFPPGRRLISDFMLTSSLSNCEQSKSDLSDASSIKNMPSQKSLHISPMQEVKSEDQRSADGNFL